MISAAQHRITAVGDLHARTSVARYVVVLQRAQAPVAYVHAALLAVVDPVAAQDRVGAIVNGDARKALAGDIAAFQQQAPRSAPAKPTLPWRH